MTGNGQRAANVALVLAVLLGVVVAVFGVVSAVTDADTARARGQVPVTSPGGVTSVCLPDGSGLRLYSGPDGRPFAIVDTTDRVDAYYCPAARP